MVYRQLPGQADSPEREPERVQPVPEHYEGVNFPYRGTEKHGVEVPADARYGVLESDYKDETPDEYLDPEPEPEPIPVRVVTDTARERLDWRATRFSVTEQGQQILGRHDKRRAVRIKVHEFKADGTTANTDPIYLGHDAGTQPYTGFRLDAGETLYPFISTEDVWAVTDAGTTVEISIMYEFAVEL